jgi:predicted TIM-barrel fold metal-dependent hydrolase
VEGIGVHLCDIERSRREWTRRAMLGALATALPAAGVAAQGPPAAPRPARPAIDVHHHFLPPFYKSLATPWLNRFATGVAGVLAWTPEASLKAMDEANVERAILSVSAPGVHFGDDAAASDTARRCNDYAAALCAAHPGRFAFFAALPMPDVEGSIGEAERALKLEGAIGVGLLSNYGGHYLGEAANRPLFAWLEKRRATVYVHPTNAPCCAGLVAELATPLIEFPVDTGRTIASLLWSGTLSSAPNVRFIFSHGGGILPMVAERVEAMGHVRPDLAARVPEGAQATLRRLHVDTASVTKPEAMAALLAWLPSDQILYGTDFPWGGLASSRAALSRLALPPGILEAIERSNALRLFA